MNALFPIALNGFREARRNRVTVVVFAFALILVLSATVALDLTVTTFRRVMTDLGLGAMGLITVFLAIFLGSAQLPKEIERRTIFMVLAKPISRNTFLVGRFLGNVTTVTAVLIMMALLLAAQFLVAGPMVMTDAGELFHLSLAVAVYGMFLEIILLSALCFFFASAGSQFVTTISTIGLYFLGHMAPELYKMASRSKNEMFQVVGKGLYYTLPNLDRLDFKGRATYMEDTPWSELLNSTAYTIGYTMVLLSIACFLFQRRDFK
jgi:Cu-processing system permease protein